MYSIQQLSNKISNAEKARTMSLVITLRLYGLDRLESVVDISSSKRDYFTLRYDSNCDTGVRVLKGMCYHIIVNY